MWPLPTRLRGHGPTDSPSTLLANEAETEEQPIDNPVSPAEHQKTNKLGFFFVFFSWATGLVEASARRDLTKSPVIFLN